MKHSKEQGEGKEGEGKGHLRSSSRSRSSTSVSPRSSCSKRGATSTARAADSSPNRAHTRVFTFHAGCAQKYAQLHFIQAYMCTHILSHTRETDAQYSTEQSSGITP